MKRAIEHGGRGLYGVLLFAALTAWTVFVNPPAFGGGGNTVITTTTSSSSHTTGGCPAPPFRPDCFLEGMTLICVSTTTTIGPACIGINNLDVANELPCTDCSCVSACEVPPSGTPFCVRAGTLNINTNTDTTTFLCESTPAPVLSPWALAACAGLLTAYAIHRIRRSGVS